MDNDVSVSFRLLRRNGKTSDVWLNGEHFVPEARAKPLSDVNWAALAKAEKALYYSDHGMGANAWTDVVPNEGHTLLNEMWEQATIGVELGTPNGLFEIARRVAAALAVLSFGKDFLLK